jgi:hypothetical protein
MIDAQKNHDVGRSSSQEPAANTEVAWKIVQATSNDNPLPITYWVKRMIPWTIFVGTILAYILFR